jgi:hypothetical protein
MTVYLVLPADGWKPSVVAAPACATGPNRQRPQYRGEAGKADPLPFG